MSNDTPNAIELNETYLEVGRVALHIHAYRIADAWALMAVSMDARIIAQAVYQSCAVGLDNDNRLELQNFWVKVYGFLSPTPMDIQKSRTGLFFFPVLESRLSRICGKQVSIADASLLKVGMYV